MLTLWASLALGLETRNYRSKWISFVACLYKGRTDHTPTAGSHLQASSPSTSFITSRKDSTRYARTGNTGDIYNHTSVGVAKEGLLMLSYIYECGPNSNQLGLELYRGRKLKTA